MKNLGFGMMRLPVLNGDPTDFDYDQLNRMVDAFLEAGYTYFDTSYVYHNGKSEEATRRALVERHPRDSFTVATKFPTFSMVPEGEVDGLFESQLANLGVDYIDYYLLHNIQNVYYDGFDGTGGIVKETHLFDHARRWKEDGKVRHLGISFHSSAKLLDRVLSEHPEVEFVQLQVNWADWDNANTQSRKCVETARKHGLPVIIMEPVRGGTLANPPQPVAEILHEGNPDATYVQWALRFAWGVEGLITVLSGMSSLEQMQQNLDTWKSYVPLSEDERATLERAQRKLDEMLDNPCTSCQYCMKACPKSIKIAQIMEALNRAAIYGDDNGKNWYGFNASSGKASDCIQCYSCEAACPQHIAIVGKLEEAADKFE